MIYRLDEVVPQVAEGTYVAPSAILIGDVRLEADASIWFGAVLRGDNESLTIGAHSNVQDNAVLHADPGFPLVLEQDVTVGHLAMLHGCRIGAGSLVGIGAVILNGAVIGRNCLISAKALIPEGKIIPDNSVVRGMPGQVVGEVSEKHLKMMERAAASYRARAHRYREALHALEQDDRDTW
jgi:carbonic anhydrase/acetyltransferase-like protein (isoleucine patch superfamily)